MSDGFNKGRLIAGAVLAFVLLGMGIMMMMSLSRPTHADYHRLAAQQAALEAAKRQAELMNEMNRIQLDPDSFSAAMQQYHGY